MTVRHIQPIGAFLRRGNKAGLCDLVNVADLCDFVDEQLFNERLQNKEHTLFPLLPSQTATSHNNNL